MTDRVFPTHTNLNVYKSRLDTSNKGLTFLKRKRDVLIMKEKEISQEEDEVRKTVVEIFNAAIVSLNRAKFLAVNLFPLTIYGYQGENGFLKVESKNIVGIVLYKISYHIPFEADRPLTGLSKGGQAIHNIRVKFVELIKCLVTTASLRLTSIKLKHALNQNSMRKNALEFLIIPRATLIINYIKTELEEIDREDFYRIKRIMEKKKAQKAEKEKEEEIKSLGDRIDERFLVEQIAPTIRTSRWTFSRPLLTRGSSIWNVQPLAMIRTLNKKSEGKTERENESKLKPKK